jgi:hypothetical protein
LRAAPNRCPICQAELTVTRLHCLSCDTTLEGRFSTGHLANLTPEQIDFLITFVRCEGKINRMEQESNWGSYPTIRNRLHEVIRAMGFEPGKEEAQELTDGRRRTVLEDLDAGRIKAADAMRILRGEEQ